MAALSFYLEADLALPWWPRAYTTDASNEGYGAIVEEVRAEARRSSSQGWAVTAEEVHRRIEEESCREGEEEDLDEDRSAFERLRRPGFLELYAGSARLTQAIQGEILTWGEAWDVEEGEHFDLLKAGVVARLMLRIRRREFWFVHMGPPCATFSIARWPKLRSKGHMWGLPTRKPHEVKLARDGSLLCCVAVEVALLCHALKIGFVIENPVRPMMWNFPPMVVLLGRDGVVSVVLDYCQFGENWRKSTRLVSNREEMLVLGCRCCEAFNKCSATGKARQVLRGTSPSGELWTKVACPYPERLCEAYAKAVAPLAPAVTGAPAMPSCGKPPPEPVVELGAEWRDTSRWKMLFRGDWQQVEHNNILEARGVVAVLRHLSRTLSLETPRADLHGLDGELVLAGQRAFVGEGAAARLPLARSRPAHVRHQALPALGAKRDQLRGRTVSARGPRCGHGDEGSAQAARAIKEDDEVLSGAQGKGRQISTPVVLMIMIVMVEGVGKKQTNVAVKEKERATMRLKKRGALAWLSARAEGARQLVNRLLVHSVDDATNRNYEVAVRRFLIDVKRRELPFETFHQRDTALAQYLEAM